MRAKRTSRRRAARACAQRPAGSDEQQNESHDVAEIAGMHERVGAAHHLSGGDRLDWRKHRQAEQRKYGQAGFGSPRVLHDDGSIERVR